MKVLVRSTVEGPAVVPVEGWPCGVPGLAITETTGEMTGYSITHVRSGTCVLWFPDTDPEGVLAAAQEVGLLADWTRSGADLLADPFLGRRVCAVGHRFGCQVYRNPPGQVADGADIG
jgi:hypothetical protein